MGTTAACAGVGVKLTVAPGGPMGTGKAWRISSMVAPCERGVAEVGLDAKGGEANVFFLFFYLCGDEDLFPGQTW